ncbi:GyrI-like domain-containing protein [Chitinophaga lutea]
MHSTDLCKEQAELVAVDAARYICVEGSGPASHPSFAAKTRTLSEVAQYIRKISRLQGHTFRRAPLEVRWSTGPGMQDATQEDCSWKLRIQLPSFVSTNDCKQAVALAGHRNLPWLNTLFLEQTAGSLAVQIMHTGSHHDEQPTLHRLHAYVSQHDLEANGAHTEIYLTDPHKTPVERLKTILRVEVRKK